MTTGSRGAARCGTEAWRGVLTGLQTGIATRATEEITLETRPTTGGEDTESGSKETTETEVTQMYLVLFIHSLVSSI